MRILLVAFALASGISAVAAQSRLSTTSMSCAQARAVVLEEGAVVLGTGGATYDRFVSSGQFCQRELVMRQAFARTTDNPQCPVGSICVQGEVHSND
ncbi:MAG TPA: hypothetical protein VEA41_07880 [Salinarimonas sp.]|nr:hypothetical protein [Salinarimonas sp.]